MYDASGRPWMHVTATVPDGSPGAPRHMAFLPKLDVGQIRQIPSEMFELEVGDGIGDPHNPSMTWHNGAVVAIVRCLNMKTNQTTNVIGLICNRRLVDKTILADDTGLHLERAVGHEDCRLLSMNGSLKAVTMAYVPGLPLRIAVMGLKPLRNGHAIDWLHYQKSPRHEKNWMPAVVTTGVLGEDRLRLVYSIKPLCVLDYNLEKHCVEPAVASLDYHPGTLRGGSQLIPYVDGWLAVVHQVHHGVLPGSGPTYAHRFAVFDKELTTVRVGPLFYFKELGIEFCAGLVSHQGKYLLSFGFQDKKAMVAEVSAETVEEFLVEEVDERVPLPSEGPPSCP